MTRLFFWLAMMSLVFVLACEDKKPSNSVCGNKIIEGSEVCDKNLKDCDKIDPNYISGTATCEADCNGYDVSACVESVCGNKIKEGVEVCEQDEQIDCGDIPDQNYSAGTMVPCKDDCTGYVTTNCVEPICGDKVKEGVEVCEQDDQIDCGDMPDKNYMPGTMASCKDDCTGYDESGCVISDADGLVNDVTIPDTTDIDMQDEDSFVSDAADDETNDMGIDEDVIIPDEDTDFTIGTMSCNAEVCIDSTTNLAWSRARAPQSNMTQDAAVSYCNNLSFDGADNWRLPNINELRSLIRGCLLTVTGGACAVIDPSCLSSSLACFSMETCAACVEAGGSGEFGFYWDAGVWLGYGVMGLGIYFWSSSLVSGNQNEAWIVDFDYGTVRYQGKEKSAWVRCVRGPL